MQYRCRFEGGAELWLSKLLIDPWQPKAERHSIQPPLVGYGGTIPRVRPEHTGVNNGEQAAAFVEHFGPGGKKSVDYNAMKRSAPAGGASALGTKPFEMPGTRGERARALCTPFIARTRKPLLSTRYH